MKQQVKRRILLLCLASLMLQSNRVIAQDLEDTIEDELGSSSADEAPSPEEELSLDEGDSDDPAVDGADKQETAAPSPSKAPTKTPAQKKSGASAPSEDEDDTDLADEEADGSDDAADEDLAADEPGEESLAESLDEAEGEEAQTAESQEPAKSGGKPKDIYAETLGTFDDNVNSEFEERMFRIFSQPSKLSSGDWQSMIASHSQGLYRVQRGDTLWDISRTFFGDGNIWPKLWSENADLTNPHEIVVGKGIAFISGTEQDAPAVRVTDLQIKIPVKQTSRESEAAPTPVYPEDPEAQLSAEDVAAGTVLEEQPIVGGRPDLPEPLTARRPVLKRLPPSFVDPLPPSLTRDFDSTGLDVGKRKAFDVPPTIYLTSYLSDGVPASIGIVDEIQAQEKQAAFLQYVILKLDREANVGERFSAVMPRGNVSNKQSRSYGPIVEIGGTVEIVEAVDPARRAYRAVVIKSVMPIEPKAIITEMPLPKVSFSRNATRADVEARVIGGEYDKSRKVMGSGSVVYLDQGTTGGLQEGQILAVRASRGSRRKNTDYPNDSQPIAVIKVARALERVSTAVILDTTAEVTPGDVTGGPLPQPSRAINALGSTRAMNVDNAARPSEDSDYQEETDDLDEDLEDDSNLEAEEAAD